MKNIVIRYLYIIVIIGLSICCNNNQHRNDCENIESFRPLIFKHIIQTGDITNSIDSIKIINLSSEKCLLSMIKKMLILDNNNFVIMDKNGVYEFSSEGSFVRQYGGKGRGPNEYIALTDISCVDGRLYILDGMNKVLVFNTSNGKFVENITPVWDRQPRRQDGMAALASGGFYIFSANVNMEQDRAAQRCLYEFDANGRQVASCIPCNSFTIPFAPTYQGVNNSTLLKPFNDEVIMRIDENGVMPAYRLDFDGRFAPVTALYKGGTADMKSYLNSNYYKNIVYISETENYLAFHATGPAQSAYGYICNKSTGRGVVLQAQDQRTIPTLFLCGDAEYLYFALNIYNDRNLQERTDPLTKYIVQKTGYIHEEKNPTIVGVRFNF